MRIRFADKGLERLESDPGYAAGLGRDIVRAFRKVVQVIRNATDERDFYAMKSLHYEKLKGQRSHQRSMRLNIQFRLIVEIDRGDGKTVVVMGVEKHYR